MNHIIPGSYNGSLPCLGPGCPYCPSGQPVVIISGAPPLTGDATRLAAKEQEIAELKADLAAAKALAPTALPTPIDPIHNAVRRSGYPTSLIDYARMGVTLIP